MFIAFETDGVVYHKCEFVELMTAMPRVILCAQNVKLGWFIDGSSAESQCSVVLATAKSKGKPESFRVLQGHATTTEHHGF